MSALVGPSGDSRGTTGLSEGATEPRRENGLRAFSVAMAIVRPCSECGESITTTVYVFHRRYLCADCVTLNFGRAPRGPVGACEWCDHAIVIMSTDGRVQHDVCSQHCREARRAKERKRDYPDRVCPAPDCPRNGEPFTPHRHNQKYCIPACQVRANVSAGRVVRAHRKRKRVT